MPLIDIKYDDSKVEGDEILALSETIQDIVSKVTGIEDVFAYANSSQIAIKIAPIEVFVQMTANKIADKEKLTEEIRSQLSEWKRSANFKHPISLTLMPMDWRVIIGI